MHRHTAQIIVKLDFSEPARLSEFLDAFKAISSQYQKFVRHKYPSISESPYIYIDEIKEGSIEAHLVPFLVGSLGNVIETINYALILEEFVERYSERIKSYFVPDGKDSTAKPGDLNDFMSGVTAIANDPNGSAIIEAADFEDDEKQVRASFKFKTKEAKQAKNEISKHKEELEKKDEVDYHKVSLTFHQTNVKDSSPGARTGEWATVESISKSPLRVIYVSSLAEEKIKYVIRESVDNIYKKAFVVDLNVETKGGRPIAYRITHLHDVFDISE